ncbi:hypothetical protein NDG30_001455 [Salmonella enterica]|nr:hypothetical protein [Salmonella enterica]
MEIIFRNIPLVRSGYSGKRGELSVGTLCMIPTHSYSRVAPVYYKNIIVGRVQNLTFTDMQNGVAELRGDVVFDCSYDTVAKLVFKELYPVVSICATPNNKAANDPYLAGVLLSHRDAREFEDQQPLDLSELRELMKGMEKSEKPGAFLFRKRYDDVNSGFLGTLMLGRCGKIHFNKSDTLEAVRGYLIINTKDTISAVKISEIEVIESIKNKDETENVFIRVASGTCAEMRNSNIGARDLIEILEQYKESQLVALKAS